MRPAWSNHQHVTRLAQLDRRQRAQHRGLGGLADRHQLQRRRRADDLGAGIPQRANAVRAALDAEAVQAVGHVGGGQHAVLRDQGLLVRLRAHLGFSLVSEFRKWVLSSPWGQGIVRQA